MDFWLYQLIQNEDTFKLPEVIVSTVKVGAHFIFKSRNKSYCWILVSIVASPLFVAVYPLVYHNMFYVYKTLILQIHMKVIFISKIGDPW